MDIASSDIRRAAMDLLARREHGSQELVDKLTKRFRKIEASVAKGTKNLFDSSSPKSDSPASSESESGSLTLVERIEVEVERLSQEGLQSDVRLAEAFIQSRANRGQGPVKIKSELRQKGIADHIVQGAFEQTEQDWYALAAEVSDRKFRRSSFGAEIDSEAENDQPARLDAKERAKRSRFLQQRGFTFDHISALED